MTARRPLWILTLLLLAPPAGAVELTLPGKDRSMRVGLTQLLVTEYHTDVDVLDGNPSESYFDIKNRTGIVLMHGTTSFNLRFDAHGFAGTDEGSPHQSRYTLEKISLSSMQRAFEITGGDFYIRVGRGLALDLTRVDEMFRDTTLRGAQFRLNTRYIQGQVFGGWVNPLEVDDFTERPVRVPTDVIAGVRVEARPHRMLALGLHYVGGGLESTQEGSRNATHTIGGSLELPDLLGWLSLYGEFDYMRLAQDIDVLGGMGAYLGVTANRGPVAVLLEFKFYQHFQFLNDLGSEVDTFVYHRPPTLMWEKQEVINNHDVIGPRLRLDYRIAKVGTVIWASYGYFYRSDAMPNEGFFERGIPVHDAFGGVQQSLSGGALDVTGGYRLDRRTGEEGEAITDFSQGFVDVELSLQIFRGHTVELEALFRRIEKAAEAFSDFQLSIGYRPSKWFAGTVSYEYSSEFPDTNPADEITTRNHFGGVAGIVNFTPSSHARLFAGSTRGGVRCIDGFCRQLPPFIGVKLETVLQF